ncbi:hypothetical protein E3N88_43659 [Mikania micrantha]|uniref:NB-ARC domain-containing protein n=1 Tax=Mikania micrantha TaxID=192012 RepID=A0A5N6LEA8_9ASTR|nr:hypothetical protein E3N88_43659 [Mikania micrantha]
MGKLHQFAAFGEAAIAQDTSCGSFKAVTRVGSEFLGVETSSSSSIAFPKLEKLKFSGMEIWEEWEVNMNIEIMPCIYYLSISRCKNLKSLPQEVLGLPIKKLRISRCDLLKQRYQTEGEGEREITYGDVKDEVESFKSSFCTWYKMKDLGRLQHFLSLELCYNGDDICIL